MGKLIEIKPGFNGVYFSGPDRRYNAGQQVTLTDAEYAGLPNSVTRTITLINGSVDDPVYPGEGDGSAPSKIAITSNGVVRTVNGDGTLTVSTLPLQSDKYLDGFGNYTKPTPDLSGVAPLGATGTSYASPGADPGYWQHLKLNFFNNGSGAEPFMAEGNRSSTAQRSFWLNENGSPRGAAVNDEPALKIFGPNANRTYAGYIFQMLKAYGQQDHIWSMHMDGSPRVGTALTKAANVVVVAKGASAPAGLPDGTVIVELSQ